MLEAAGGLPPLPMDHPTNKYGWEEMLIPAGGSRCFSAVMPGLNRWPAVPRQYEHTGRWSAGGRGR